MLISRIKLDLSLTDVRSLNHEADVSREAVAGSLNFI